MTTIFDLLNTLNNNSINGCKRQCPMKPSTTTTSTSNNNNNNNIKKIINIIPEMDFTMYDDKLVIDVELTGVSKENIEIDIKDSILTIQGEKKKKTNSKFISTLATLNKDKKDDKPSIEEFEDEFQEKLKINKTNTSIGSESPTSSSSQSTTINDKESSNTTDKKYISERSFGYFKRYLDLTKVLYQLDLNSISTKFENGLLTIEINKKSNYSSTIKISIN